MILLNSQLYTVKIFTLGKGVVFENPLMRDSNYVTSFISLTETVLLAIPRTECGPISIEFVTSDYAGMCVLLHQHNDKFFPFKFRFT